MDKKEVRGAQETQEPSTAVRLTDLMTIPRAAKFLGTTRQAINQAFRKGRIAGYKVDRVILLDRHSVEEYRQTRHPGGRPKKLKA